MPNFLSPDTFFIEKNISEYAPVINSSVVGLVGFASKGPTNVATLITSPQALIDTFGEPMEAIPGQALEGAIEILESTNSLYFVRAADETTAANASSVVEFGSCPALEVCAGSYGVTSTLALKVQVWDNDGVQQFANPKIIHIATGTVNATSGHQGMALAKAIGGTRDSDKFGAYFDSATTSTGFIVGNFAGSGAKISVSAYDSTATWTLLDILTPLQFSGANAGQASALAATSLTTTYGISFSGTGASGLGYVAQSLYPGAGYNGGTKTNGDTSGNSITIQNLAGPYFNVVVNDNGALKESFKCSLVSAQDFIENKINTSFTANLKSKIIQGSLFFSGADAGSPSQATYFADTASTIGIVGIYGRLGDGSSGRIGKNFNPRFIKALAKTTNFSGGNSGIGSSAADRDTALIGSQASTPKTGMQALDNELLNISIAAVPGISTQATQNALVTLAESTQSFIALLSPPYGVGSTQAAIDWHNGFADSRNASINSSYAAIYWPWVQTFDVFASQDRWYDPVIYAARQMVYTDANYYPWFAPAGSKRGRLTKPSSVEVILNQGDADSLYSGGNVINPIMNFPQEGIVIWGQRTSKRTPAADDRINVKRLVIQTFKVTRAVGRPFIFEPNDEFTWDLLEAAVNPVLDKIKRQRGITEFRVVCDETTNTPERIDNNQLWCKLLVKPTKTAEFIIFELNLTNQSAQLGNL